MTSSAHALARKISSVDAEEISAAQETIERFDSIDPRFSIRVLSLIDQMGRDYVYARGPLRKSIERVNRTGLWTEDEEIKRAKQLIRTAVLSYSSYTLVRLVGNDLYANLILPTGALFDQWIESNHPELQPDIFEEDLDTLSNYYKPMAAAAEILDYDLDQEENREVVAVFIAWAGKQENMDEVLAYAMKTKSVQPKHLSELLALQKETTIPLHDGLL